MPHLTQSSEATQNLHRHRLRSDHFVEILAPGTSAEALAAAIQAAARTGQTVVVEVWNSVEWRQIHIAYPGGQ